MMVYKLLSILMIGIGSYGIIYSLFASKSKIDSLSIYGGTVPEAIISFIFEKSPILGKRIILLFICLFLTVVSVFIFIEI